MNVAEQAPLKSKIFTGIMLVVIAWVLANVASQPDRGDIRWDARAQRLNTDVPCTENVNCQPTEAKRVQPPGDPAYR